MRKNCSLGLCAHFSGTSMTTLSVTSNPLLSYKGRPNRVASRNASTPISSARSVPHLTSLEPTPRRWCFGSVNMMSRTFSGPLISLTKRTATPTYINMVLQLGCFEPTPGKPRQHQLRILPLLLTFPPNGYNRFKRRLLQIHIPFSPA